MQEDVVQSGKGSCSYPRYSMLIVVAPDLQLLIEHVDDDTCMSRRMAGYFATLSRGSGAYRQQASSRGTQGIGAMTTTIDTE
jgi:hypothetical protein